MKKRKSAENKKLFNSNQAVTLGVDLLFALLMAFTFVSYTFFTVTTNKKKA